MVICNFALFDRKCSFWANLVQKVKVQAGIWYLDSFEYVEFNGDVYFFCFLLEIRVLGKFGPKIQDFQDYLIKVKFDTYTNLNMKNSVVVFIFSVLVWKCPCFGKLL